jgi:hypothetical protein
LNLTKFFKQVPIKDSFDADAYDESTVVDNKISVALLAAKDYSDANDTDTIYDDTDLRNFEKLQALSTKGAYEKHVSVKESITFSNPANQVITQTSNLAGIEVYVDLSNPTNNGISLIEAEDRVCLITLEDGSSFKSRLVNGSTHPETGNAPSYSFKASSHPSSYSNNGEISPDASELAYVIGKSVAKIEFLETIDDTTDDKIDAFDDNYLKKRMVAERFDIIKGTNYNVGDTQFTCNLVGTSPQGGLTSMLYIASVQAFSPVTEKIYNINSFKHQPLESKLFVDLHPDMDFDGWRIQVSGPMYQAGIIQGGGNFADMSGGA